MPRSAAAGDATPGQDSATASQEWQVPSVTGASWATGALENTAVSPVTAPGTVTSALGPASTGKEAPFEMGLHEMKQRIANTAAITKMGAAQSFEKVAVNHKRFLRLHLHL